MPRLLTEPNHVAVSTLNEDGSVLSTVARIDLTDGALAVNSAVGRRWPTNQQRDPRITVLVYEAELPPIAQEGDEPSQGDPDRPEHSARLALGRFFGTPVEEMFDADVQIEVVPTPARLRRTQRRDS